MVVDRFVEAEGHGLPVTVCFSQSESPPGIFKFFSVLIAGLKEFPIVEANAHGAFSTALVAAVGTTKAEADIIVNLPIVDHGSIPIVEETGRGSLIDLVATVVGDGFRIVFFSNDEVVDGNGIGHGVGIDALVGGDSIVNKVSEVTRGIVLIGNTGGIVSCVCHGDPIADEVTMAECGNDGGEEIVACDGIAVRTVIEHRHCSPVVFVSRVF